MTAGRFAGSITAALFLSRFVRKAGAWVHLDIFAWHRNRAPAALPGGTDQGIRAVSRAGFVLVDAAPHHSFGADLVGENWELEL